MATKKPSAKQLAARAKFIKMVRAKAAAKKKAAPKKVAAKKVGAYKKPKLFKPTKAQTKAAAKRLVKQATHKDTKSHNVSVSVVSGIGAKTQAGAIRNVFMKRNLRKAGFSVPSEIATNDLQKIYKSVFGKQPITIAKIKMQLKKGIAPNDIINK